MGGIEQKEVKDEGGDIIKKETCDIRQRGPEQCFDRENENEKVRLDEENKRYKIWFIV